MKIQTILSTINFCQYTFLMDDITRYYRLKTAFVKALQQEQEIEQRLAQAGCPSPDPPAPKPVPKAATPTRRVATPPAPLPQVPPPAPTLTPTPPAPKMQEHPLVKLAESGKFSPHHAAAAAALQQQLLRGKQSYTHLKVLRVSIYFPCIAKKGTWFTIILLNHTYSFIPYFYLFNY